MAFFVRRGVQRFVLNVNNAKSFQRHYPAPRKRFYKSVHITESDGKYEINLDKRKLKTPLGNLLQLPNEALANAVAIEWDMQSETLQQHNMNFTSLCNTAIDNPCQQSKESIVCSILEFLTADTLCYRSSEPRDFVLLQRKKWDPVLIWFQDSYNVKINVCEDISGVSVPEETVIKLKKYLLSFSNWSLLGIKFAAENLKSLILTLGIINRAVDVESAVHLSRLETIFQVDHWGKVEWAHDVEQAQTISRVAAATLFTYLNEVSRKSIEKNSTQAVSFHNQAETVKI